VIALTVQVHQHGLKVGAGLDLHPQFAGTRGVKKDGYVEITA